MEETLVLQTKTSSITNILDAQVLTTSRKLFKQTYCNDVSFPSFHRKVVLNQGL